MCHLSGRAMILAYFSKSWTASLDHEFQLSDDNSSVNQDGSQNLQTIHLRLILGDILISNHDLLSRQGSHPSWQTLKTWNFPFTLPGLENIWNLLKKWVNSGIFNSKPGHFFCCKYCVSRFTFQNVIYPKNLIYMFVISTYSTQPLIQSQINRGFHFLPLELTWKIHGILCYQRNGSPA